MLIFWKQRLVMLSVPKTGSSAYLAALAGKASIVVSEPPELKHAPVYRYNRFFRPMMEKMGAGQMDILAVIREPVSWLGSWYRYRQRGFLEGKPASTRGISFDAFCQAYCEKERPAFANVGSQAKFVEPRPNGVGVTHLFQYEEQARLIAFLEARLEMSLEFPQRNISPPGDLSLSPQTEALLRRKSGEDFALWNRAGEMAGPVSE